MIFLVIAASSAHSLVPNGSIDLNSLAGNAEQFDKRSAGIVVHCMALFAAQLTADIDIHLDNYNSLIRTSRWDAHNGIIWPANSHGSGNISYSATSAEVADQNPSPSLLWAWAYPYPGSNKWLRSRRPTAYWQVNTSDKAYIKVSRWD
jgi:hypothetical protein